MEGNPLPKLETEPACVSTAVASWGWRKQGCTAKGMGAWAVAKDYLGGLVPREPEGGGTVPSGSKEGDESGLFPIVTRSLGAIGRKCGARWGWEWVVMEKGE